MRASAFFKSWLYASIFAYTSMLAANQTTDLSPVLSPDALPFNVVIEKIALELPNGIHSGVSAEYHGKWLFLAGRTNGLHGFGAGPENFPPQKQNTVAYVVDLKTHAVYFRNLDSAASGLTQKQIDELSVTSPQGFQNGRTLYMSGGYGINTATGVFDTKPVLTAIDVPGFMKWVMDSKHKKTAAHYIKQTSHPLLQVTGGYMDAIDNHLSTLLIFGQNFSGFYTDSSDGSYTNQVRRFQIINNANDLYIQLQHSEEPNPNYRRRDLNVVPIIQDEKPAFLALSGVFTLDTGVWTVPVYIKTNGKTSMADPSAPGTFKQAMNHYVCPAVGLYTHSKKNMYIVLMGGISFGFFNGNVFETDDEIPFINQMTTIKIDKEGHTSQYLLNNQYPTIASTGTNPGNTLLFGAGAEFMLADDVATYSNGVIRLDKITQPVVLGYIVGGIMSTLPNTNTMADSAASPYIFKVTLFPK